MFESVGLLNSELINKDSIITGSALSFDFHMSAQEVSLQCVNIESYSRFTVAVNINFCNKCVKERPLGRPRRRGEDNIKMNLQEVECGGTDWIEMA